MAGEYQVSAFDREWRLLHTGPHEWGNVGPSTIRRYVREWEEWANGVVGRYGPCPTGDSRRRTAFVLVTPADAAFAAGSMCDGRTGRRVFE